MSKEELTNQTNDNENGILKAAKSIKLGTTAKRILVVTILILVVLVGEFIYLRGQAKRQAEEAYLEGMADGEANGYVIEVDDGVVVTVKTLQEVIAPASELISYKYFYTTADVYEKSRQVFSVTIPFTTDKEVYVLSGVVNVGIDLNQVDFDVDEERKMISVRLPEPKVMSHYIDTDSFKTYNLKNSVFTSSDLEDYAGFQEALKQMEEDKLAENSEFWTLAKDQTKNVISSLINVSGIAEEYRIDYTWYDPEIAQ